MIRIRLLKDVFITGKEYTTGEEIVFPNADRKQAEALCNSESGKLLEDTKPPEKKSKFSVVSARALMRRKKDKSFIIQDFLLPKTVNMLYSPPGEYKSLITLDACLSIVVGEPWLGLPVTQGKVLICDNENSDSELRNRLVCLVNGHDWSKKRALINLNLMIRQGTLDDASFIDELHDYVTKNKVSLIVFDTFRRFGNFEENSSDDANRLYASFQKIINGSKAAILFLHHAKKEGGTYRGSVDILGQVDAAYQMKKGKEDGTWQISCEKSRSGEIQTINGHIEWQKEAELTKIVRLDVSDKEKEDNYEKWRSGKAWLLQNIEKICPLAGDTFMMGQLVKLADIDNIDRPIDERLKKRTLERIMVNLVNRHYLAQTGLRGEYRRLFSNERGIPMPQGDKN